MEIINGPKRDLPNATLVLILGVLSLIFCWVFGFLGLILGIVTLVLASEQRRLYQQAPGEYTEYSLKNVNMGRVFAIISICIAAAVVLFVLLVICGLFAGLAGLITLGL